MYAMNVAEKQERNPFNAAQVDAALLYGNTTQFIS